MSNYLSVWRTFGKDDCTKEEYTFWMSQDLLLHLDTYHLMSRRTRRHHYRVDQIWSRLMERQNTVERPNIPDWARQDVLQNAREKVRLA